ncbi:MAG: hypothetical protein Q9173_004168 [Seirophora scorigena]
MSGYVQGYRHSAPKTLEQRVDRLEHLATDLARFVAVLELRDERRAAEAAAAGIKFEKLSDQPKPSTSDQPQPSTLDQPRPSTAQLKSQFFNSEGKTLEQRIEKLEVTMLSLLDIAGDRENQQIQRDEAASAAAALTLLAQSGPSVSRIRGDSSPETLVGCGMKEAPDTPKAPHSSSSDLPSTSQLFNTRTMRHAASGAAYPIPDHSFAHPDNQTRSKTPDMRFMLKAKELLAGLEPKPLACVKQIQKSRQGSDGQTANGGKSKSTHKNSVPKDIERGEQGSLKTKRSKHFAKDAQTKIGKTSITKPGAGTSGPKRCKGIATGAKTDGGDARSDAEAEQRKEKNSLIANDEHSLGLTEALRRRRDWTPSKETPVALDHVNETGLTWNVSASLEVQNGGFTKLVEDFGYLDAGVHPAKPRKSPVKRDKSLKKKPQTITDKATAPFAHDDQRAASIRHYFGTPSSDTDILLLKPLTGRREDNSAEIIAEVPSRKAIKASKVKTKVVKKTNPALTLVSPEAAIETANRQDLLFGTCSQLAREESPTFTRDVQQAVKESEMMNTSTYVSRENESQVSHQSSASSLSTSRLSSASRKMWSEAARDSTGSLLNVDVVDLVNTPQPSGTVEDPRVEDVAPTPPVYTRNEDFTVTEDPRPTEGVDPPITELRQLENSLPRSVAEAFLRERPRSRSPVKEQRSHKDAQAFATEPSHPHMPNYNGYNDADLKKELTALGFKPIRRRQEIILLLQRCWESKKRVALRSLPHNVPGTFVLGQDLAKEASEACDVTKTDGPKKKRGRPANKKVAGIDNAGHQLESVASPQKARGRPRKNAGTKNAKSNARKESPIEETSDAEHASPPPPPRQRSSTKRKGLSTPTTSSAAISTVSDTMALFVLVTRAITSFPPTHDVKNLTWREKMLLYDPIVLEDLADWLNKEGLSRVGCEDKISPGLAKQWCESQSICCVWRENLRGGTRARY